KNCRLCLFYVFDAGLGEIFRRNMQVHYIKNRSFMVFGVLSAIVSILIFLLLESSTHCNWYWNFFIATSIIAVVFYGYDKVSSKAGAGRIPELILHFVALAGGFGGALLGMLVFRHKSNFRAHPLFIPMIIIGGAIWAVSIYWLIIRS